MTHDVYNFVITNFIYAELNQLCLFVRKTNFSPSFTPKLAISRHYAYQLNG